jgi:hypothetical protein
MKPNSKPKEGSKTIPEHLLERENIHKQPRTNPTKI